MSQRCGVRTALSPNEGLKPVNTPDRIHLIGVRTALSPNERVETNASVEIL